MFDEDEEAVKKHTSEECLAFVLEEIKRDPLLIKMKINLITSFDLDSFNNTMWPAVFVESNWFRTKTERPDMNSKDEDGNGPEYGTNHKTIRHFTNEAWEDFSHDLRVSVTSQYGELTCEVFCSW